MHLSMSAPHLSAKSINIAANVVEIRFEYAAT